MAELGKGYKKIISDLEENIKDSKELEFVKGKITELTMMFMDTMDTLIEANERNQKLEKKVRNLQNSVERIEDDIYVEDDSEEDDEECECDCECGSCGDKMHDNDYEFEILCPYCNHEFITGKDTDLKNEIECPNCHNLIELDWEDCCDGECNECKEHCYKEEEEVSKIMEDEDNNYKQSEGKLDNKEENKNTNKEDNTKSEDNENEDDM